MFRLQKTKLFIPLPRANLVERPRLLLRLNSLLTDGRRAALIAAPAGYGKTTLVVQWLSRQAVAIAWLFLDARDNQPACFFAHLIAALKTITPKKGGENPGLFLEVLQLLELPGVSPEEIVTLLANDLIELPEPFLLVLDDYHAITNPWLHRIVDLLLEAQPPQMRLVLLSREDPDFQLARRRACGQLVELRQAELSFTLEEAAEFLSVSVGIHLTVEQIKVLETRTEGWAAGLQMAALALQAPLDSNSPGQAERFIQDFSGNHRFILEYLIEEVLTYQPEDVQSFLLETAILDWLQADLCAQVTGRPAAEAQKLIERLSKANLFVLPLDEEGRCYRYHNLFGDLLRARLHSKRPQHAAVLFRRASDWFAANGDPYLAVEHALKAQDFQRAVDLIEQYIAERWQTADINFYRLVQLLPFEVVAERPTMCLLNAWISVIYGQTDRILFYVEAAERALQHSDHGERQNRDPSMVVETAFAQMLRAYMADLSNQPVALDDSLTIAYASIPQTNPGMRNSVAVMIGMIYFMEGDFASAIRYYEDALALDKRVNGANAIPIATMRMCFVLQAQGRLHQAVRRLDEAEAYMRKRGVRRFYISGSILLWRASILLEWNRLNEAKAQIHEGMQLLEDWPLPTTRSLGAALLAQVCTARGHLEEARANLALCDEIRMQTDLHPFFLDIIEKTRVRVLMAEGDQNALQNWVKQNNDLFNLPLDFRYEARRIELCRVWIGLGRFEQASPLLEQLAQAALATAAHQRNGNRIIILTLLACTFHQQPEKALPILEEALLLAEPEGYLRTFLDAGEPLVQVLRLWLREGKKKDDPQLRSYAHSILSFVNQPESVLSHSEAPRLPEPLSRREQEVLLLIAEGLTNQQIADRLVISIRTVKKHVENIHGKLGVTNRTHAVTRARELALIE